MAKKAAAPSKKTPAVPADEVVMSAVAKEATAVRTTKPRSTTVPPKARAAKSVVTNGNSSAEAGTASATSITNEMIAERAYHLWLAGEPGNEIDHWCKAERELKGV